MDVQKQDLRVSKTHRALVEAMFTLLKKQSFSKITVNDLCVEALCSRATFYAHFQDKYDLLRFCMESMKKSLMEDAQPGEGLLRKIVEYMYNRPEIFKHLFMEETNTELNRMIGEMLARDITLVLEKQAMEGRVFNVPPNILAVFITGGLSGLLMWWIGNGYPVSKEEMFSYLMEARAQAQVQEC